MSIADGISMSEAPAGATTSRLLREVFEENVAQLVNDTPAFVGEDPRQPPGGASVDIAQRKLMARVEISKDLLETTGEAGAFVKAVQQEFRSGGNALTERAARRTCTEADFVRIAQELFGAALEDGSMNDRQWVALVGQRCLAANLTPLDDLLLLTVFSTVIAPALEQRFSERYSLGQTLRDADGLTVAGFVSVQLFNQTTRQISQLESRLRLAINTLEGRDDYGGQAAVAYSSAGKPWPVAQGVPTPPPADVRRQYFGEEGAAKSL